MELGVGAAIGGRGVVDLMLDMTRLRGALYGLCCDVLFKVLVGVADEATDLDELWSGAGCSHTLQGPYGRSKNLRSDSRWV